MKSCILLIIALSMATMDSALADRDKTCSGDGSNVRPFIKGKVVTKMPCKYNAVRVECGIYIVTLTPGNIYLHPRYYVDTMWLGIRVKEGNDTWKGHTSNKIGVKYFNGWKNELFIQRDGNVNTSDVLVFNKDSNETWAEAKNGDFRVIFVPWDPDNTSFPRSQWEFQCLSSNFKPSGYPDQICGREDKKEMEKRSKDLGLLKPHFVLYYDVLTNTYITQTNEKCVEATSLMTLNCTEIQRKEAINTCLQILSSHNHTKCVTKYSCDPMDVLVECIKWVCSDYADKDACEKIGKAIDGCRSFNEGNLTEKVTNANCYKDFLPIETN